MQQLVAHSVNGVPIRLTTERWRHIQASHQEMEEVAPILETIQSPDVIQEGRAGALLAAKKEDDLYLVVIYRELGLSDGFVLTAYKARRLGKRRTIWRR